MNLKYWRSALLGIALSFGAISSVCYLSPSVYAQETSGGLQGTVKDASGAVIPRSEERRVRERVFNWV